MELEFAVMDFKDGGKETESKECKKPLEAGKKQGNEFSPEATLLTS